MCDRWTALLTCCIFSWVVGNGMAGPPLAEIQKKVADGYAKVDKLSVSYLVYERYVGDEGQYDLGNIEYRFDRATKQLAIGADEGNPSLLIKNNRLFVLAFRKSLSAPTYLAVNKGAAIGWNDVNEAVREVRKDCPLFVEPIGSRFSSVVLPFLDGGMKRLFTEASEVLNGSDPKESLIFEMGNSDAIFAVGANQPKLDPKRGPFCVRTKNGSSTWTYAFDRFSGRLNAARHRAQRAGYRHPWPPIRDSHWQAGIIHGWRLRRPNGSVVRSAGRRETGRNRQSPQNISRSDRSDFEKRYRRYDRISKGSGRVA